MKDCGQNLDKTVPTKFRNRKFATLYLEAHIDPEKFHVRTGVPPPAGLFKPKTRAWNENTSISLVVQSSSAPDYPRVGHTLSGRSAAWSWLIFDVDHRLWTPVV
ncbi:hypothetical protein B0H14DRAFT_2584406 [Mycena olivaceomarginata]|nr:hypothetical protein B0H14DRAFT_2584406 [Mycena olivaceomarginata]